MPLLVVISKRMGLTGLSEVINIRGHKVMLIEWSPHFHAQGVSFFTPFSLGHSISSLTPPPTFPSYASYTSPLETLYCWHWLFPPTALWKQALSKVDAGIAKRVLALVRKRISEEQVLRRRRNWRKCHKYPEETESIYVFQQWVRKKAEKELT